MAQQLLPTQAPDFTLDHVRGHAVSLSDFRGRTAVVVFGGKESAGQVKDGIETIRRRYGPDQLPVISVSDLEPVPRPARIIAKSQLKKAFEEAVKAESALLEEAGMPRPDNPEAGVIMLMDWKGEAVRSFGLSGVDTEAVAVVVDEQGQIVGSGGGADMGEEILAALRSSSR